jgi:MFS family permease
MRNLLSHLGPPLRALRGVVGNRPMARMQVAFLLFNVAEPATWVAMLVYAFDAGGTGAVGFVSILLLIPAGVLAPVAASLGDRFPRERVVRVGYLVQGVLTAAVAAAMAAGASSALVYTVALVWSVTFSTSRPGHHALLPSLARSPEEVAAGNSVSSLTEGLGGAIGALLAAGIVAVAGPGAVFIVSAVILVGAAALTLGVRPPAAGEPSAERFHPWALAKDTIDGLVALATARGPRLLVTIAAVLALATGVVGVLTVPLAIDVLGLGDPGVGFIGTAWSVGSFVGAGASVAFVTRRRLAWPIVGAAIAFAIAAVGFGVAAAAAAAAAAAVLTGVSITLLDVLGRTLLQRVTDDAVLTRVFGAVEALWLLGYGAGSALAPPLESWLGLDAAFIAGGAAVLLMAAAALPGLRAIDRAAVVPERQLALLGRIAMFAPLPRTDLERLANQLDRIEVPAGAEVIRQGDVGDRFYVVDAGRFAIVRDGADVAIAGEGEFFGEVALLHDVPRTATVRALEPSAVWALDQEEFLSTVTGVPQSHSAAHEVSEERMRWRTED